MMSWALVFALHVLGPSAAPAAEFPITQRYALLVGANTGNLTDPQLRYAQADAKNMAATLQAVADVPADHIVLLRDPTAELLRRQFGVLKQQIAAERARGGSALLVVYYSGHADAVEMHLGSTTLPWHDLVQLTNQTTATTRLIVVDACRSGELTRVKGARRVAPFLLPVRDDALPTGLAILASSSANEVSQESDVLHGSLFTHHFIEALRGAADRNADGRVSLNEAFQYSADSTAFTSAQTDEGLQHATFRYRLQGRSDLILTHPVASIEMAFLNLPTAGEYRFNTNDATGPLALDAVVDDAGRSITLPAGRYFLQARTGTTLHQGIISVNAGQNPSVDVAALPTVELTRLAAKGTSNRVAMAETDMVHTQAPPPQDSETSAEPRLSVSVGAGATTPLLQGFSVPWQLNALGSYRLDPVFIDFQIQGGRSVGQNSTVTTNMTDLAVSAGVRWYTMQGPFVFSIGPRVGAMWIQQSYDGAGANPARWHLAPEAQAVGRIDWNASENFYIGLEGGGRAVLLTTNSTITGASSTGITVQPYMTLGAGIRW